MHITAMDLRKQIVTGSKMELAWLPENKASVSHIAESLVALANGYGGLLVIGAENGTFIGVENPDDLIDDVLEATIATEPPLIIPLPQTIEDGDITLIVTQVPSGMPNVYAYQGRYLQYQKQEIRPLNPRNLRQLMIERGTMSFETNVAPGATRDDLDWEKVLQYVRGMAGFDEADADQVLLRRGCLARHGTDLVPTNAGLLLFGSNPQQHVLNSDITAVRFAGETMGDTFNRQDITGTLPNQIKRVETFLVDHLRKNVTINDKMERDEAYEYPMEAAREVVVNAVAHRDYGIQGDNIRLFIFGHRLEVHSPGNLAGPMTLQNLKDERFSRNPVIVQVLSDLNFIERLGYGVDRVIELMKAQNLRQPDFKDRAGGFLVTLYNLPPLSAEELKDQAEPAPVPRLNLNGKYNGIEINDRQEAAIAFLYQDANSRITNSDLQSMFPTIHPESIRRDLANLVRKKIFVKMGQKRGSYYVLKDFIDAQSDKSVE